MNGNQKIKSYFEDKVYNLQEWIEYNVFNKFELLAIAFLFCFVIGFIIYFVLDMQSMERNYQKQVQELNRYYREREKELNINNRSFRRIRNIDEFDSIENWLIWEAINDDMDMLR